MEVAHPYDEVLERAQGDYFWAPADVTVVDRPEIKYAYSSRAEGYFNAVVRVRPDRADPVALVHEVSEAHGEQPSQWSLNVFSNVAVLRDALGDAGYAPDQDLHGYILRPDDYDRKPPTDIVVRRVATREDLRALYAVRDEVFGSTTVMSDDDYGREVAQCADPAARVARFVAFSGDEPVGTGGLTFFDDLDFAFIWAGGVREAHRGRGIYTALLRARLDTAAARGIAALGLYARDDTSGPIVAAHGFERLGPMVRWSRS